MSTVVREVERNRVTIRVVRSHAGDSRYMYQAWRPAGDDRFTATMEAKDGTTWGRVDTLRDSAAVDQSDHTEHMSGWVTWTTAQQAAAYELIYTAFPEARDGYRSRGEILMFGDPAPVADAMRSK